jgi:hypothetical protein
VNFEKIRRTLGFTPEVSVQQGVSEILTSLRQGLFDHVEEQKHFFGNYKIFFDQMVRQQSILPGLSYEQLLTLEKAI